MKAELQNLDKGTVLQLLLSKMRRVQKIAEDLYLTSESVHSMNAAPLLGQTLLTWMQFFKLSFVGFSSASFVANLSPLPYILFTNACL